jgi:mono/diheme cytochrome c family protein
MRARGPIVLWSAVLTGLMIAVFGATIVGQLALPASREGAAMRMVDDAQGRRIMKVDTGDATLAQSYYARISGPQELNWNVETSSCDSLLHDFLGYQGVGCESLESVAPDKLAQAFPGQVEAVRYFAPKISTVGAGTPPTEFGWRKLVRLRAQNPSKARDVGVTAAFILFNFLVVPGATVDPFASDTVNTQVMLIRSTASANGYWAYWMMYETFGKITDHLNATFENGAVAAQGKQFFVPTACIECHGQNEKSVYLSFLDVENWIERTQPPEEFTSVTNPLPDLTGPLVSSSVMATIRNLNAEIAAQNAAAGAPLHVREASAAWVKAHPATQARPLDIHERGFVRSPGDPAWSSTPDDVALLRLLNRYCYRCHGTKRHNVFEREWVVGDKAKMISAIEAGRMPEDRNGTIPEPDRTELLRLLRQIK